uniref:Uncharacterized protein n=1 Tax=Davidia involucrata TaxID=16924 RepID=A0A5B7AES3_DAVIN
MEDCYIFALITLSLFTVLFKLFIHKPEGHKNLPPSPPGLPIIGHLHLLKEPLYQSFQALSEKYGPIFILRFGTRKVLVITSPSAVEECFTSTNDIVFANRPLTLAGKHLHYNTTTVAVAPYGDLWRNLRRITTLQVFSTTCLAMTSGIRQKEVKLFVNQLMKKGHGHSSSKVELKSKFFELPFNILTMMIAGKKFYGENVDDENAASQFRYLIEKHFQLAKPENDGEFFPILQWLTSRKVEREMVEMMKMTDEFLQNLVDERRQILFRESHINGPSSSESKTMIDNLLLSQQKDPHFYTDEIIKGIIWVLLLAGTESSSSTMEWVMSLLLNHPDVMEKVKAEIDVHVGQDHLLEEQELRKLNYLQNVISETLRLYPPGPLLLPHKASDDCKVGGYDVPRGATLLVNAWAIHRDPKLWKKPEKFMPERFEDENIGEVLRMIPFGTGRRGCPGVGLANRVVGLVVGTLIQAFEWERVGEEEVDMASVPGTTTMPKLKPLEAICRPRAAMVKHLLI